MSESYRAKYQAAARAAYVKEVVSQPTVQGDIKVKADSKSPTGVSQVKADSARSR